LDSEKQKESDEQNEIKPMKDEENEIGPSTE
jgi:hypothetical protein